MKQAINLLFLTVAAYLIYKGKVMKKVTTLARGIRNNNPMNLREGADGGIHWKGEHDEDLDKSFEEFQEPIYGIRAGARVLINYQRVHGIKTVEGIINRYAPPSDNNDTEAYINHVSEVLGVEPDQEINVHDFLFPLVKTIIKHENGVNPYSDETILNGIALA